MKLITLIISFLIYTVCFCQTENGPLVLNKVQSSTLSKGQTHTYSLLSVGDQFIQIHVEQEGIDVKITAFSPTGKRLGIFDSPNGKNGPELVTLSLKDKGNYTFEIKPLVKEAVSGNYTIELKTLDPIGKTPQERIDQMMFLNTSETPGASISVMKEGELVFSKGYGMANLEYDIPVGNSTIFHIASISKQFTAFSILLLAEDGKLNIDDDIRKYIPEVPDFGKTITLRHLANHTSGLRDQWNLLVMAGWRMDDVITTEQVLKLISRQESLNFEPGDEILYSNTGYTLLAEVVARVSGMSFAEFTEKRIFAPLGMKNSLFYDDQEKVVKNRAYSYQKAGNGYKKSVLNYAIPGATSLFTTTEDLTRWSSNFESPTVGNDETMKTMHTEGVLNNGDSIGYAFGQAIGSFHGLTNYSHGGADAGFRTIISRFPNEKLTVVIFGNEDSFRPSRIADQIAEIYIGDKFVEVNSEVEEPKKPESVKSIKVKQSILKKYVGDFELTPGFIITISLDSTKLYAQGTGQGKFELFPESKTLFATDFEAKFSFPKSSSDHVSHLTLYQSGREMKAERVEIIDEGIIELSNYTGFYYSDELATGYTIELLNDTLFVSHSKASDFRLSPIMKDSFSSTFWAFGVVEYVRNDSKEIIGINVSNGRVRNVYFEKR